MFSYYQQEPKDESEYFDIFYKYREIINKFSAQISNKQYHAPVKDHHHDQKKRHRLKSLFISPITLYSYRPSELVLLLISFFELIVKLFEFLLIIELIPVDNLLLKIVKIVLLCLYAA